MSQSISLNQRDRRNLNLVVLISGSGTNLQSLLDTIANNKLSASIAAVISNRADALGLKRAEIAGVQTLVLSDADYRSREEYDMILAQQIEKHSPDYIVLAGFMRILSRPFIEQFEHKILNIHPSLLPKFKGTNTHQRALEAGEVEHGATVHLAAVELDAGPILGQARVPVLPEDTVETLQSRVLAQEHILYPSVIEDLSTGRIGLKNGEVIHNETKDQTNSDENI